VSLALGLLLALGSAGALNWGFFRQQGVASALPPLSVRRPLRSLAMLFTHPRWLVGFAVGLAGWAMYLTALALAPLSLVQATSAGGVGLLALLVWRADASVLTRAAWIGVALSVAGLLCLGVSLAGGEAAAGRALPLAVVLWLCASLAAALLAAGPAARVLAAGAGFGVAAGLLYAAGDVASKAAVGGRGDLVFVPAVLASHGLAFVALQLGFQRGHALATAGVATLVTNALPIAAGMTVFHEGIPGGAPGPLRLVSFAAVVAGAALLAGREQRGAEGSGLVAAATASQATGGGRLSRGSSRSAESARA
jgi:hypothetical protein